MATNSPFPGMDPWLEWYWGDVHTRLVTYACDQIQELLGPGLVARMQERVYIESPFAERRNVYPDVHVIQPARKPAEVTRSSSQSKGVATIAEPDRLYLSGDLVTEPYIEILDAKSDVAVITTIEFVSEGNKSAGNAREKYLQKQREVLASDTNLVEIDLLRGGQSVTMASPEVVPPHRRSAYHACVRRISEPEVIEYYAMPLRQPLLTIGVPLRRTDKDVALELQRLIDEAYRKGRYNDLIDYTTPSHPPLKGDDDTWAAELIRRGA